MNFGRNRGCKFVESPCVKSPFREFCEPGKKGYCSFNFKNKGLCYSDSLSDGCHYTMAYSNANCENPNHSLKFGISSQGETWGVGSRCIIGNIIEESEAVPDEETALCYAHICTRTSKIVFFTDTGVPVVCSVEGQKASAKENYKGWIVCPDF